MSRPSKELLDEIRKRASTTHLRFVDELLAEIDALVAERDAFSKQYNGYWLGQEERTEFERFKQAASNASTVLIERDALRARCERYREALLKIYEPMKCHHWEEDAYTRAGCFQFIAQQALADGEQKEGG